MGDSGLLGRSGRDLSDPHIQTRQSLLEAPVPIRHYLPTTTQRGSSYRSPKEQRKRRFGRASRMAQKLTELDVRDPRPPVRVGPLRYLQLSPTAAHI